VYKEQVQQYHARFENYYAQQNFLNQYFTAGNLYPISAFNPGATYVGSGI
jgi:hypothetical protein